MAHQTLRRQWFEHTWLTKRYADNGLSIHGSPNDTQTMVCASMAHQTLRRTLFEHTLLTKTLRRQWFAHPWLTKRYADNGLSIHGSPNVTQAMVGAFTAHQTLRRQWFEHPWLTKRYADNGLSIHGLPNGTQTMV